MTAMSLAVMDRSAGCGGCGPASSLHIGVCICDVSMCECESECFLHDTMTNCIDRLKLTYLNEVFGAGQLDVAAKAVPARFDTL